MNPHFVSGRRRRRHYTASPTRSFIRAQTALEELPGLGPCEDSAVSLSVGFESRGELGGPLTCEWGCAARRCCEPIKGPWGRSLFCPHLLRGSSGKTGRPSAPRPGGFPAGPRRTGKKVLHQHPRPPPPLLSYRKKKKNFEKKEENLYHLLQSAPVSFPTNSPGKVFFRTGCRQPGESEEGASGQAVWLPCTSAGRALGTPGPRCPPAWAGLCVREVSGLPRVCCGEAKRNKQGGSPESALVVLVEIARTRADGAQSEGQQQHPSSGTLAPQRPSSPKKTFPCLILSAFSRRGGSG